MTTTVLFVPGLRDHVPDHWQTLMAQAMPGSRTVPPLEHNKLSCAARVDALDRAIADIVGPLVLCAHSAGCLMVAHWARQHSRPIKCAVLVTPADIERPLPQGYPTLDELDRNGWLPVPRTKLPFPSLLAASSNDPLAELGRTRQLASDWESQFLTLGAVGHLNPASGFGPWPAGQKILRVLAAITPAGSPAA